MKKLLLPAAIITCFALLSFTQNNKAAGPTFSNAHSLAKATGAVPFNEQITVDVSDRTLPNNCTGERLDVVSGTQHFTIRGVINNNHISGSVTSNFQNLMLVDENGNVYRGNGINRWQNFNGLFDGSATITYSQGFSFILATAGKDNNSVAKAVFHITITTKGEVTVVVDNFSLECR